MSKTTEPRLILDAMGGDFAPHANLEGALKALPGLSGELILVGDQKILEGHLAQRRFQPLVQAIAQGNSGSRCRVRIVHAPETIEMADSIRAIRNKPEASINVGCRLAAESWARGKTDPTEPPQAIISAGHSGALMASAWIHMGRLPGVERPAIAVQLPTVGDQSCILLDAGANIDCKPEHLRDFAVMGAVFAQVDRHRDQMTADLPRVALLSNGEERSKGNELTRATLELLERHPSFTPGPSAVGRFVGYVEGKDLLKGHIDVVVTDGFAGNLVLKSMEGVGSAVISILKKEAKRSPLNVLGFLMASGVLRRLKQKLDYAEYGTAPLLGVAGYAFVCHGRSKGQAIKNALFRAQNALRARFVERLELTLAGAAQPAASSSPAKRG